MTFLSVFIIIILSNKNSCKYKRLNYIKHLHFTYIDEKYTFIN